MTTSTTLIDQTIAAHKTVKEKKKAPKLIGIEPHKAAIKAAMKANRPALLIGGAATGKSTLAQECAYELGRSWHSVELNGYMTPDQLIGRMQAKAESGTTTYFQYGVIVRAMREGSVLILNELNAALADTLFVLHAVLETNPRLFIPETEETIYPADGFCVIATMNPSHDYAGTKELNAALFSRFDVVRRFDELQGADLLAALRMHAPVDIKDQQILNVSKALDRCRQAVKEDRITTRITLRECISALNLMNELGELEAIHSAIYSKLDETEQLALPVLAHATIPAGRTLSDMIEAVNKLDQLKLELEKAQKELAAMGKLREVLSAFTAVSK